MVSIRSFNINQFFRMFIIALAGCLNYGQLACVSTEKESEPVLLAGQTVPGEVTRFRLVRERGVTYPRPLPAYIPLYLELRDETRLLGRYLKYMAWDFDADGAPDLLEELDPELKIIARHYDFVIPDLDRDYRMLKAGVPSP